MAARQAPEHAAAAATDNPKQTLTDIYTLRVPIYALADLSVKADPAYAIEDMVSQVIEALLTRPDVLEAIDVA